MSVALMEDSIDETETALATQMLEAAREMKPSLRERAASAEANRQIPCETIEEFRKAGFLRILQPKK